MDKIPMKFQFCVHSGRDQPLSAWKITHGYDYDTSMVTRQLQDVLPPVGGQLSVPRNWATRTSEGVSFTMGGMEGKTAVGWFCLVKTVRIFLQCWVKSCEQKQQLGVPWMNVYQETLRGIQEMMLCQERTVQFGRSKWPTVANGEMLIPKDLPCFGIHEV